MRLWRNSNGAVLTDEQVLAYISAHGSLSAALESGDVECIASFEHEYLPLSNNTSTSGKETRLSDFLNDGSR